MYILFAVGRRSWLTHSPLVITPSISRRMWNHSLSETLGTPRGGSKRIHHHLAVSRRSTQSALVERERSGKALKLPTGPFGRAPEGRCNSGVSSRTNSLGELLARGAAGGSWSIPVCIPWICPTVFATARNRHNGRGPRYEVQDRCDSALACRLCHLFHELR